MAAQGTLDFVATHLARAMRPLADAVSSPNAFRAFLLRLGWEAGDLPPAYRDLAASVDAVTAAVEGLGDDPDPLEILAVLDTCAALYDAVQALDEAPTGVDATEFFAEFTERTFELLVVDHLARELPGWFSVAEAIGVIERELHRATPLRPGYVRSRLRLDALGEILADPPLLLARVYGWGTPDLRFGRIARHGAEFLQAVGINGVAITTLDGAAAVAYLGTDPEENRDESDELVSLRLTIFATHVGDTLLEFGFAVSELPPTGGGPAGIIVEPLVPTELTQVVTPTAADVEFPLGNRVLFRLRAGSDLSKRLGLVLKPGDVSVQYPFDDGVAFPPEGLGVAFVYAPDPAHVLLGRPGGSRLEARKATAALDLGQSDEGFEAVGSISADDVVAVVSARDLDGFLGDVAGGRDVTVPLSLQIAWSSTHGFRLNGGAGFEVAVDPHVSVGGLRVDEVRLGVAAAVGTDRDAGIDASATVAVSGGLGPVTFALAGIGVRARLSFEPGNAGPLDVDAGFVPPNGVGLQVDGGGIVSGGGFLRFEPDQHRYSGTFQLRIGDVEVTAIGVLLTRLPDGSPGYSLLITISSEFAPIPLGYGLRLDGVGGLIGIHRTADTVALGAALKAGSVGGVLFPKDPVRDASQILASVSAMFPVARGRYVFGPMGKLSWGVGIPLVFADVGLFLELPHPVRLFLLGQLSSMLPSPDEPLVKIHIDVLGLLDVSRGELSVDAALRDSQIAGYPMTGEMALRARWRHDPLLAAALGGMHPDFPLPAGFPTLKRLQIALGKGDNPRLDLQAYLAVTANTVQLGAALELYAAAGGFNVTGHLGFDALVHLMPFRFQTDVAARVALRRGSTNLASISLDLMLAGPRPWRAKGKGSLSLLFFSISFHFDVSWGGVLPLLPPVIELWPILRGALSDARSWTGVLDPALRAGVHLLSSGAGATRLDPAARLELRQKVVPLRHRITRFGGSPVAGPDEYRVSAVTLDGSAPADRADVEDFFAPASFEELDDAAALSRPSFERMAAGVRVGGATEADAAVVSELTYETVLLDVAHPPRRRFGDHLAGILADSFLTASAAAHVPGGSGRAKFRDRGVAAGLTLSDERFVVAGVADLAARPDLLPGGAPVSAADAHAILARRLAAHPEERGTLNVVLATEAVP